MKLGVIADDFTGASDIALTLAEGGMRTSQFVGVPSDLASETIDAGVVSLKSRTAPKADAISRSLEACDWLIEQGVRQIVLKVCSTFDSTEEGNIGPVLDALAERLGADAVMVCPAFPENGRSVYQGHLFVGDRLLHQSGMENHPLTPMRDSDLRHLLAVQSQRAVAHVPIGRVQEGASILKAQLTRKSHVIVDAISNGDLIQIGAAAADAPLICGGSGIALGLPTNFGLRGKAPDWKPILGPGVVISGSCSQATRDQVADYRRRAPSLLITAEEAVSGAVGPARVAEWVLEQVVPPLVYSSDEPDKVAMAQSKFGTATVAQAIEALFSELARLLAERGVRRIVVAGGETSGAVIQGLGFRALEVGPRLAAGVPVLLSDGRDPIALALKSGNFGDPDFFFKALGRMEGRDE